MSESYTIEINVTKECNFACSYCFEGDHCRQIEDVADKVDDIKNAISKLLQDEWFNKKFDSIILVFWGGEPTLRPDILKSFVDEYKDDERFAFMMYSNGSRADIIMEIFEPVKPKFEVQISYDGNPIHDKNRKHMLGGATSTLARETIKKLKTNGFNTLVKSTLRTSDIKHIPEVWEDFKSLSIENNQLINYSPTIEHSKKFDPQHLEDFEEALKNIVLKEVEHFKEYGQFLFSWVNGAKRHCNLFQLGVFVDVDGGLYYCHGCPYQNECGQLWFGDIMDDCIIEYVKNNYMKFQPRENKKCEQCIASTCLNCNVVNYINSDMDEFIDRWYDFECTPVLCEYYKLFGKYNEVLRRLLRR